jgi:hypothetical protein
MFKFKITIPILKIAIGILSQSVEFGKKNLNLKFNNLNPKLVTAIVFLLFEFQ